MSGVTNFQNYFNMELMFNELSIEPLSNNIYEGRDKAKQFALTMASARKNGFSRIRSHHHKADISLSEEYSLQDYLFDKTLPNEHRTYKDILLGTLVLPFIKDEDELIVEAYIESNLHFNYNGVEQDCLGLSAAFFYETLSISFGIVPVWQNNSLTITNVLNGNSVNEQVNNVFSAACFGVLAISDFVENLGEVDLQETDIIPNEKNIILFGDHHGKKYLKALSDKLKNSPYVIEMRSTDFGGNSFIRKINSDGVIEVVVMKSDERFALWVKTTGGNYRETKAIAENLRERYS